MVSNEHHTLWKKMYIFLAYIKCQTAISSRSSRDDGDRLLSKEGIKSIGKRRSAVRRRDYVLSRVRFMLVSSTPVAESSLFFTWRRDVMVRLEDGWIYVTLEHSCSGKHHSEAMFIIYDVLHCCIIYHRACFAAVLHWFVCLRCGVSQLWVQWGHLINRNGWEKWQ